MKPSDTRSVTQPFFTQGNLSITTLNQGGKILGWVVKNGKYVCTFSKCTKKVIPCDHPKGCHSKIKFGEKRFLTKGKILATWKKVEKYVNKYL